MNGKKMGMIGFVVIAAILAMSTTAAATTVYMDVPPTVQNGSQFTVSVVVDQVTDLAGFDIFLKYDPAILQYDGYSLGADTQAFTLNYDLTNNDTVEIAAMTTSPGTDSVTKTDVKILEVTFTALAEGNSTLEFAAGSKLVQYNATSKMVEDYPGVAFQNATVTVTNVKPGDVNGDNVVDFKDLVGVLNLILLHSYNSVADLNNNGKIDFEDLIGVLNIILSGG